MLLAAVTIWTLGAALALLATAGEMQRSPDSRGVWRLLGLGACVAWPVVLVPVAVMARTASIRR